MKQKIQANIQGYLGKPVSLFGVIDKDTRVLTIVTLASKPVERQKNCFLISSDEKKEYDLLFRDVDLKQAIKSYYDLKNSYADDGITPLLLFGKKVGSADPSSTIELNGLSDSGMDYIISPDITNQQIGALAMCLYSNLSTSIDDCFDMFNEIEEITEGGYWGI